MFLPYTPRSVLKERLQQLEEKLHLKDKVKYVEQIGQSIGSKLVTQDPWKEHCSRNNCLTCEEKPGQCMKKGLVYQFTCLRCQAEGKKGVLWGDIQIKF